ncbi:MAG: DUF4190 domain-containing protein [Hamadaea sp.]|uniref:DUF4190 domain-containing protein n=1 Tax=Hamadaea sp. TaxID=2024425 RepID=UPI0017F58FED|nr:DUF4190 domain-containing protein [Hamadaea sp.]NUT20817.1 DUF4190 domain-containing protein [Hamadaea sp.]
MADPNSSTQSPLEREALRWNPLAIAALVVAVCGAPGGIAALIMGAMALRRSKRQQQRGNVLAVVGMLLGLVSITLSAGVVAIWINDRSTVVTDLRPGDCLPEMPGILSMAEFEVVSCTELHAMQVYAVARVPDGSEEVVASRAEVECVFGRENLTSQARDNSQLTFMYLRSEFAENGQVAIYCLAGLGRWHKTAESIVR